MNTDETPPANPLAPFHTLPDQQLTLTDIIRTGPHPQPAELPWRPLEPGEKAQPGDECNSEYNTPDDSLDTGWVDCVCSIGKTQAECDSLRFRTRRPLPSAPPIGHAWREFDWPEDSADKDNGAYCNICITCERQFIGHKRRNVCKSCANPVSLNDLEAQGDDEQPAAEQAGSGEALNTLAAAIHKLNAKWWHDENGERLERNKGELLCLIHSEISEAMEGERKSLMDDKLTHRPMAEVELADALIRILDYSQGFGYDIGGAVVEKLAFNQTRADHSHEERAKPNGKKW